MRTHIVSGLLLISSCFALMAVSFAEDSPNHYFGKGIQPPPGPYLSQKQSDELEKSEKSQTYFNNHPNAEIGTQKVPESYPQIEGVDIEKKPDALKENIASGDKPIVDPEETAVQLSTPETLLNDPENSLYRDSNRQYMFPDMQDKKPLEFGEVKPFFSEEVLLPPPPADKSPIADKETLQKQKKPEYKNFWDVNPEHEIKKKEDYDLYPPLEDN